MNSKKADNQPPVSSGSAPTPLQDSSSSIPQGLQALLPTSYSSVKRKRSATASLKEKPSSRALLFKAPPSFDLFHHPLNSQMKPDSITNPAEIADPNPLNGTTIAPTSIKTVLKPSRYKEEEVLRLILQQLNDLGYKSSVEALEKESGYILDNPVILSFKRDILSGNWDDAKERLKEIPIKSKTKSQLIIFQLKKQQYLEALLIGDIQTALSLLQNDLSQLSPQYSQIQELSRLLMCSSLEEFKLRTNLPTKTCDSRLALIDSLYEYMPSETMLASQRLQSIFDQSRLYQVSKCTYHSSDGKYSLYRDHVCKHKHQFAESPIHTLEAHNNEVWFVAFSNNGKYLASGSKDNSIIIWETNKFKQVHTLTGHANEISSLSWSPSDNLLASASNDKTLRLWDPLTGKCVAKLARHLDFVTSVKWMPDGLNLISAALDKKIVMWDSSGNFVKEWASNRVHDLTITSDGSTIIIVDSESNITFFNINSMTPFKTLKETDVILSIFLTADDNQLLVGTQNYHLHLWDINAEHIIQSYIGFKQGAYVTRCSIGGVNNSLVFCGSADGSTYIWNKNSGVNMQILKGHTSNVNCCASYNYSNKLQLLVTASDDFSIKVWQQPPLHRNNSTI